MRDEGSETGPKCSAAFSSFGGSKESSGPTHVPVGVGEDPSRGHHMAGSGFGAGDRSAAPNVQPRRQQDLGRMARSSGEFPHGLLRHVL